MAILPAQSGLAARCTKTSSCTTAIRTSPSQSPLTDSTLPFDSSGARRRPAGAVLALISGTTIAQFSLSSLPQATSTSTDCAASLAARRSESDSAALGWSRTTKTTRTRLKRRRCDIEGLPKLSRARHPECGAELSAGIFEDQCYKSATLNIDRRRSPAQASAPVQV